MPTFRYISGEEPLTLSGAKKVGPMQICQVVDGPWHVRLDSATVVFEPSAYGGTGAEVRVGMVLHLNEEQLDQIRQSEEKLRGQLEGTQGQPASARWQSSIKESDGQYEAKFRPKVNKDRVKILSEDFEAATGSVAAAWSAWPSSWRGRTIDAVVRIGGTYCQSKSCGPLWEVTHVHFQPEVGENPFA